MKATYEQVFPLEGLSFHVHTYEKDEFDAPWHYHPEYELTYILSSKGVRYVGNHFENFKEDDLVLLGPNLPHCWKNSGNQTARASAVVIQWKEDLFGEAWFLKNKFESAYKLIAASRSGIKFEASVATRLKTNFLELSKLDNFEKVSGFLKILNELSLSNNAHKLCSNDYYDKITHSDQERINTIFQYVKDCYASKITLSGISSQVHMTNESFSRFFSHFHGKPFFSFLNEYRINVACNFLIETNLPISQIAFASGFESLPFFFRQFKKYKNCSPKHFKITYNENLTMR